MNKIDFLTSGIRNPSQLNEAIEIVKKNGSDYEDVIWAIHKYKWYNWYQNLHIKTDSPEDIENTLIFKTLETDFPQIHADIEFNITHEVEKLNGDTSL